MCDTEFNEKAEFGCPRCGRLPRGLAILAVNSHEYIGGPGPLTCSRCRAQGGLVCRGQFRLCRVRDGLCFFHACSVGPQPFPFGLKETWRYVSDLSSAEHVAELRAEEETGIHHGMGIDSYGYVPAQPDDFFPERGGGIFG